MFGVPVVVVVVAFYGSINLTVYIKGLCCFKRSAVTYVPDNYYRLRLCLI